MCFVCIFLWLWMHNFNLLKQWNTSNFLIKWCTTDFYFFMLCNGLNFIGFQLVSAIQKQNSLIFLELEDYGSAGAWFMIQKVYFMDIVLEYFSLTVYTQVHQSKPNIYWQKKIMVPKIIKVESNNLLPGKGSKDHRTLLKMKICITTSTIPSKDIAPHKT